MTRPRRFGIVPIVFLFLVTAASAAAQSAEADRVKSALDVFQAIIAVPEYQVPAVLMHNASGIAILPGVRRVGFVVGGMRGKGVLLVRGKDGEWSRPLFVTITGGSIGWQIGIPSSPTSSSSSARRGASTACCAGNTRSESMRPWQPVPSAGTRQR